MVDKYFCFGNRLGVRCINTQNDAGLCLVCGSDKLYPIRLQGLALTLDYAFQHAINVPDDLTGAMSRVHEAFELIVYEFGRLTNRLDALEGKKTDVM